MAFNFTFADNQRLGLQIVGAKSTGTSEQPIGFKRAVVDEKNVAGEVMYVGRGEDSSKYKRGLCYSYYIDGNGRTSLAGKVGAPIFGVCVKDGDGNYIQTGGLAYVQVDTPLTKLNKVYFNPSTNKLTSSSSSTFEVKGAIAGDPANMISVKIGGTPTDLYPVYLNNPHL